MPGPMNIKTYVGVVFFRFLFSIYNYFLFNSVIRKLLNKNGLRSVFPKSFCWRASFWLQKITTDPHILTVVNTVCMDDRHSK